MEFISGFVIGFAAGIFVTAIYAICSDSRQKNGGKRNKAPSGIADAHRGGEK